MTKFLHNRSRAKDEMLLEWCLPENSFIEGYEIEGERINIAFILHGKAIQFDTEFHGWQWLERELKARQFAKEHLSQSTFGK